LCIQHKYYQQSQQQKKDKRLGENPFCLQTYHNLSSTKKTTVHLRTNTKKELEETKAEPKDQSDCRILISEEAKPVQKGLIWRASFICHS
jgi:hypothetical protein